MPVWIVVCVVVGLMTGSVVKGLLYGTFWTLALFFLFLMVLQQQ